MVTLPQAPSILDSMSNLSSDIKNISLDGRIKSSSSLPQAPSILDSIPETKQPTEVEVDEKATPATLGSNETWLASAKAIYEDEVGESWIYMMNQTQMQVIFLEQPRTYY
jgi:hypothetical protein